MRLEDGVELGDAGLVLELAVAALELLKGPELLGLEEVEERPELTHGVLEGSTWRRVRRRRRRMEGGGTRKKREGREKEEEGGEG